MYVLGDIETAANERSEGYFAAKAYEPAANLKDPVKIEASIAEKRRRDVEQAALHWWTGRVICISATYDGQVTTFSGEEEESVLRSFFDWMPPEGSFLGKSADVFDRPYLVGRALAHDIGIPSFLRPSRHIDDIDHIFGFSAHCSQRSSLANYAFGLGIEGKLNHSSAIASLFEARDWEGIEAHCSRDVAILVEMWRRWQKPYVRKIDTQAAKGF